MKAKLDHILCFLLWATFLVVHSSAAESNGSPAGTGINIGGIVRTSAGRPIESVTVAIKQTIKDEVGQTQLQELAAVKTDTNGRWHTEIVPLGAGRLNLALTHPRFITCEYDEADSTRDRWISRADLTAQKAVFQMEPGIIISGQVTDDKGKEITDATVQLYALVDTSEKPKLIVSANTDAKGNYEMMRFDPGIFSVLVTASEMAPELLAVEMRSGMHPQNFVLKPGVSIKGIILDDQKKPVSQAMLKSEMKSIVLPESSLSDENGKFLFNSLPPGPVTIRISKNGHLPSSLDLDLSREVKDLAVMLNKTFSFTGKVVDAESGKPIPEFTVYRGIIFNWSRGPETDQPVSWRESGAIRGKDGSFDTFEPQYNALANSNLFFAYLVYAKNYQGQASRLLPSRGQHEQEFHLKKAPDIKGQVVNEDGKPIVDARVAMLGFNFIQLGDRGQMQNRPDAAITTRTDSDGRYTMPALLPSPRLLITSSNGASIVASTTEDVPVIHLKPWPSIDGMAKTGTKPWANQELLLSNPAEYALLGFNFQSYKVRTDDQGRFRMDYVPPGSWNLVRLAKEPEGTWRHCNVQPFTIKEGEILKMNFGGVGRPIVGKLKMKKTALEVDFSHSVCSLSTRPPTAPPEYRTREEILAWQKQPEIVQLLKQLKNFRFVCQPDGAFRIDNVSTGSYALSIIVENPDAARNRRSMGAGIASSMPQNLGEVQKEIEVPEIPGGVSDEPIDLGTLIIESLM